MHGRAAILRKQNRDQPMQILWAFRYNPLRAHQRQRGGSTPMRIFAPQKSAPGNPRDFERQLRIRPGNYPWQFPGRIIAFGNYAALTRRPQFCSDKIAWLATKRSALRAVHVFITTGCRHHANNKLLRFYSSKPCHRINCLWQLILCV
jgi:hypothetical protein